MSTSTAIRRMTRELVELPSAHDADTAIEKVGTAIAQGYLEGRAGDRMDTKGGVPIDGVAGAIGIVASAVLPIRASTRERITRLSTNAILLASARAGARHSGSAAHHGDFGAAPLIEAAKEL
jgi:hypothetical protein